MIRVVGGLVASVIDNNMVQLSYMLSLTIFVLFNTFHPLATKPPLQRDFCHASIPC
jgi:hypothetical protein